MSRYDESTRVVIPQSEHETLPGPNPLTLLSNGETIFFLLQLSHFRRFTCWSHYAQYDVRKDLQDNNRVSNACTKFHLSGNDVLELFRWGTHPQVLHFWNCRWLDFLHGSTFVSFISNLRPRKRHTDKWKTTSLRGNCASMCYWIIHQWLHRIVACLFVLKKTKKKSAPSHIAYSGLKNKANVWNPLAIVISEK